MSVSCQKRMSSSRRVAIQRIPATAPSPIRGVHLRVPARCLFAKYGAVDRPLRIGEIEIPCYVLADGTRVLAQRGLQSGIGLSQGGGKTGARRIAELMAGLAEKGIDVRGLIARANSPIRF